MDLKKVRGKKRKLRVLKQRLTEATRAFPKTFYNEVYSIKLPASQAFMEGLPQKGMDLIGSYLLNAATTLKHLKPHNAYKIVVLLFPNNMWYSEIIVFEHEQADNDFFTRQIETGDWREQQTEQSLTYSHWTQQRLIESERALPIIYYRERART